MNIKPFVKSDTDAAIAVIQSCFDEYEGVVLELDGIDEGLYSIREEMDAAGGEFWIVEDDSQTIATIGTAPTGDAEGEWELKRLYMLSDRRGAGLADTLVKLVEDYALAAGGKSMILWTDTRFIRAHRFYEKKGYVKCPGTRELHDISKTVEFKFSKKIA